MRQQVNEILNFWEHEVGHENWYKQSDEIDGLIKERYEALRNEAKQGDHDDWMESANGALALIIILDQFSRNLYRGSSESFAADQKARGLAYEAISAGYDDQILTPMKQFIFMPLCHSENIEDQNNLMKMAQDKDLNANMPDFYAHQHIIQDFGRFPFRNEVLGRTTTKEEQIFLDEGGYMKFRQQYLDDHSNDS